RQDRRHVDHRAGRRTRGAGRGRVRRALRPHGLQRPLHRPAGLPGMTRVVVTCGALALHVQAIARRRGWDLELRPRPPELHSRPGRIAPAVERAANGDDVLVAYADCGTRGALDGHRRLDGAHCYDLFARRDVQELLEEQPGTFFLTDFLVRTFDRVVLRTLGLDRHPELREEYFRNYTRVVWLAQRPTRELRA